MNKCLEKKIKHVAIIMDGNGRWAQARNHVRIWGHIRGTKVVTSIVDAGRNYGIDALTLYAFSTENWSRPDKEVKTLFNLLGKFLKKEKNNIIQNNICFKIIGDISGLPEKTKYLINELETISSENTGLKLSFAFNYGGRSELVYSVNKYINENPSKLIAESDITNNLMHPSFGDVDLLIRTGGDQRISNFLLWQIAYAELFFTATKWPDFGKAEFISILESVSKRERRFGGIGGNQNLKDISLLADKNKNKLFNN